MLRSFTAFTLCCIISIANVSGQSVAGYVQTDNKKPLPYVSVALLRDTSFIVGGITNEAGGFRLQGQFVAGEKYTLKLSLIGYQTLEQSFTWPDTLSMAK